MLLQTKRVYGFAKSAFPSFFTPG